MFAESADARRKLERETNNEIKREKHTKSASLFLMSD